MCFIPFLRAVIVWGLIISAFFAWHLLHYRPEEPCITIPIHTDQVCAPESLAFQGDRKVGFTSLTQEYTLENLEPIGTIPSWLKGTIVGTGPAQFDVGDTTCSYWFSGLAMLHAWEFDTGIRYKNRFLHSQVFERTKAQGKFDSSALPAKKSFFSRISSALSKPEPYDNGNLGIVPFGSVWVALTETPLPVCFDPHTLHTQGPLAYSDTLNGHMTTLQFQYDPLARAWFNVLTEFASTSKYYLYKIHEDSPYKREVVATLTDDLPSYIHAFGITQHYAVFIQMPSVVRPMDLLMSGGSFLDQLQWKPELGTRISLIDKAKGNVVKQYCLPAWFVSTLVQAYEHEGTCIVDLIAYPDQKIVESMKIAQLRSDNPQELHPAHLVRITLDAHTGTAQWKYVSTLPLESAIVAPAYQQKPYRFVYGVSSCGGKTFPYALTKLDIETGTYIQWIEDGCYAAKPLFIPEPGVVPEDAGLLCSVVLDSKQKRSFLVVLDARTMQEQARIWLPHHIPCGFVGAFIPG